ncbi:MAG: hypothetical protein CMJ75_16630 [Planctomycetaceae bacterium]|nr:hypothetical protein [Planctomycetaceae bacterium]
MDDSFDPYRIWLGIPLSEQPADHYRLLGIARFETDPEVIENAANRQMSYLRTFQSGAHVGLAQRLLNEVSAAKICLLHPDRRNAYDSQLQANPVTPAEAVSAKLAHGEPADNQGTPATRITTSSAPEAPPLPQVRTALPPRTRRASPWPLLLAMMLIVILLGALIVFFNRRDHSKPDKSSSTGANPIDSTDNRLQQPAWDWLAT